MKSWQLPPQLDDLRPPKAWEFELLRRRFLDHLTANKYEYIHPPLVEYASALSSANSEHELCVVAGSKNEQLAIRADMTAQVVRMDANLRKDDIVRYCYAGEVFRTQASTLSNQRNPYQIGAELFGDASLEAEVESITLALDCAKFATCEPLTLDIGHTEILTEICANNPEIINILKRRSKPDLKEYAKNTNAPQLEFILEYCGNDFEEISKKIISFKPNVEDTLKKIKLLTDQIEDKFTNVCLYFDFAETQGWKLHHGLSWRLYAGSKLIARGGRYDGIGERFGHPRPATGFTFELNRL